MTPYYQDAYITIYHGDCLEVLPLLTGVRSIVSDPPYGMQNDTDYSRFSGGSPESIKKRGNGRDYGVMIEGDDEPFDPSPFLAYENIILFGYNHFAQHLTTGSVLVWIKRLDAGYGSFLSDAELAWFNQGCGVYCYRDLSMNAITRQRKHPNQKPISLMRWCIQQIKDPGLICDPYAGSGSTLKAAKEMGLQATGIEIVEKYCETAANRCANTSPMFPALQHTNGKLKAHQASLLPDPA